MCVPCVCGKESVDHPPLNCKLAQRIWNSVFAWFGCCWVLPVAFTDQFKVWKSPIGTPRGKEMWKIAFPIVIWCIWRERNARCFEGVAANGESMIEKIKDFVACWASSNRLFHG